MLNQSNDRHSSKSPSKAPSARAVVEPLESRTMFSTAQPLHLLIYGASYINGYESGKGDVQPLPTLISEIATAAGFAKPVVTNISTDGKTLNWALTHFSAAAVPTNIDFVIFQDQSYRMTNIKGVGDLAGSERDALALYKKVKAIATHAVPVVFEDWGRSPLDAAELKAWYPTLTTGTAPYTAAANQMQAEISRNTTAEARYLNQAIGASVTRVVHAGDAFLKDAWAQELFDKDNHHASNEGYVLSALTFFDAIYHVKSANYNLSSVFSAHGVSTTLEKKLETLADSV